MTDPTPVEQAARADLTPLARLLDAAYDEFAANADRPMYHQTWMQFAADYLTAHGVNLDAALDSPRVYEHDAEYHWIVENDGHGSSRIVAQNVLPGFGDWVASRSATLDAERARPDALREAAQAVVEAWAMPPRSVWSLAPQVEALAAALASAPATEDPDAA